MAKTDPAKHFLRLSRQRMKTGELIENRIPMHLCSYPGCAAWGCFGINVKWMKNTPGQWACRIHRDWLYTFSTGRRDNAPTELSVEAPNANRSDGAGEISPADHLGNGPEPRP